MDMNIVLILAGLIIAGFIGIAVLINKKMESLKQKDDGLDRLHERMDKQFEVSAKIVKDVTEKLSKIENTNTQIVSMTEQLQGLEDVLKNPKQRGILGEYYLETLLKNLFQPNQYQMQYAFKDGDIVDAVVKIKDKVIPIDSKFSLENYNKILKEKDETRKKQLEKAFKQDLKNRIDETAKYIKPKEGTMDFAFMFIPSEGIYYDLLVNQVGALKVNTRDLIEYAFKEKKVIIVSPTSFAAYLQTVLQGLRALNIEESVKDIVKNIHKLGNHLNSYETYFSKLGSNLGTTVGMYNKAYKEFGKIDKDVTKITGDSLDSDVLQIDKPQED
jgi:DNA recombination protein RmuC